MPSMHALRHLGAAGIVEVDDGLPVLLQGERGKLPAAGGDVEGGLRDDGGDGRGCVWHCSPHGFVKGEDGEGGIPSASYYRTNRPVVIAILPEAVLRWASACTRAATR